MTEGNVGEAPHGYADTLPAGDKDLFACCVLITLGLSFFWSLVRNAGIASLVALIGLDAQRDAAMLAYYVLLAVFAGVVAACMDRRTKSGREGGRLSRLCLACGALSCCGAVACYLVRILSHAPAIPMAWCEAVITALATAFLAVEGVDQCSKLARRDGRSLLVCAFGSALASIVLTFVLSDMFVLGDAAAALYPLGAGAGLYAAARLLKNMPSADGALPTPQGKTGRGGFWSRGRVAALIGVLVLATLLKSLADSAFYDPGLRMVKHLVGILELSLILVAVNAMRGVSAPSAVAFYTLLGGLLLGTALACAPVPMAIVYVGVATITTARVLAEALVLMYAAESIAWNAVAFFWAAFLLFVLPEMLACVIGYSVIPLAVPLLGTDLPDVFRGLGILTLAGMGIFSLSIIGLRDLLAPRAAENAAGDSQPGLDGPETHVGRVDTQISARQVFAERYRLTEREAVIASYIYKGCTVKRIAQAESVSVNTVQSHSRNLYRKLDVHSRQELIDLVNAFERDPSGRECG